MFWRLHRDIVEDCFWHRKVKHICGFYIRNLFEHRHKFGKIIEPCEPCLCSVTWTFRCQLNRRNGFSKGGCPSIEVLQIVFHKGVILQVSLNGIEFHHRVWDRRSGCKHRTTTARDFIKIATLHKKVAWLHRFGLCDTADISHFGIEEKVFIVVALVNKESVYTKFLKGNNIILSGLVVEFVELLLDRFLRAFQLLDREVISTISFQVSNTVGDLR